MRHQRKSESSPETVREILVDRLRMFSVCEEGTLQQAWVEKLCKEPGQLTRLVQDDPVPSHLKERTLCEESTKHLN